MNANPAGITPMTVTGVPLSVTLLAEDGRVAAEPPLPHAVAEDDDGVFSRRVFFGAE